MDLQHSQGLGPALGSLQPKLVFCFLPENGHTAAHPSILRSTTGDFLCSTDVSVQLVYNPYLPGFIVQLCRLKTFPTFQLCRLFDMVFNSQPEPGLQDDPADMTVLDCCGLFNLAFSSLVLSKKTALQNPAMNYLPLGHSFVSACSDFFLPGCPN